MESIKPPRCLKFYFLVRMTTNNALTLSPVAFSSGVSMGMGFFRSLEEAEYNRTIESLRETGGSTFHIFELEFPNPAYTKNS